MKIHGKPLEGCSCGGRWQWPLCDSSSCVWTRLERNNRKQGDWQPDCWIGLDKMAIFCEPWSAFCHSSKIAEVISFYREKVYFGSWWLWSIMIWVWGDAAYDAGECSKTKPLTSWQNVRVRRKAQRVSPRTTFQSTWPVSWSAPTRPC